MNKIAFIFMIYNVINHEELWYMFFSNIDKSRYNIYIHYKYDERLEFLEEFKVAKNIPTKYADISIVKAQNLMLFEALKDINNTHFIFLSGSCIPLKPFQYIYDNLEEKYSYFHIANPVDCLPDCIAALTYIDMKYLNKASQWCILNRKHSELLVNNTEYLLWFKSAYAADELCYITYLSYTYSNRLGDEIKATSYNSPPEIATTFANWEGMDYKYATDRELKNYIHITHAELLHLLKSPCFFGRKFKPIAAQSINKDFYLDYVVKNVKSKIFY